MPLADRTTVHATCVALTPRTGLLLLGASGAGKSSLALMLMGLGARLVADDRTILGREGDALIAAAPAEISGLIEARGVGILRADPMARARVVLAADLDATEAERLPPRRRIVFCGCEIDLVQGAATPHFPHALIQYLRGGRQA
ncbi:MAG: serine kinase [Paracoccaceae bacterium]|nr:MAG: serine kinase [Paracoccaceae bacterium]